MRNESLNPYSQQAGNAIAELSLANALLGLNLQFEDMMGIKPTFNLMVEFRDYMCITP